MLELNVNIYPSFTILFKLNLITVHVTDMLVSVYNISEFSKVIFHDTKYQ